MPTHSQNELQLRLDGYPRLSEEQAGEPYWGGLSIYLCELPRLRSRTFEGLTPQQQWLVILRNCRTFAVKPGDKDPKFDKVFDAASGLALGLKQGREEEKLALAGKLLDAGFPAEQVAEITGVPTSRIR